MQTIYTTEKIPGAKSNGTEISGKKISKILFYLTRWSPFLENFGKNSPFSIQPKFLRLQIEQVEELKAAK